jgi:hypothetical protein
MSGPIRQPLADVTTVTPTLNDKAVTIQANTVRTSSYTAIYNLFKTGFDAIYASVAALNTKLSLTGGTMSGPIAMGTNKITGLGTPTANQDAATKLYVDSQTGGSSTLDQVLTNGNLSQQDAGIKSLGLYDTANVGYGSLRLNSGVFEIRNANTNLVIRNENNSFRIHNFTNLDTSLVASARTFTFPNKSGTFAMLSDITGTVPTLNQVLTTGNTSQLNASIRTLGLFDPTYVNYGNVSLNNHVFIITNSSATQIMKMQDTVFSLGFHSNTKTVNLDSNLLSANRTFAFPDIDGTFAMTSYADTVAATAQGNAITSANAYTDTEVATRQLNYNLVNTGSGATNVTINATSGVATFTQTLSAKSNAYYNIDNTSILAGDKVEFSLYYEGAGFPIIMHYNTVANRIRFHVGNPAVDGGAGTATNADLVITFRKI